MNDDEGVRERLRAELAAVKGPLPRLDHVVGRARRRRTYRVALALFVAGLTLVAVVVPLALLSPLGEPSTVDPAIRTPSPATTSSPSSAPTVAETSPSLPTPLTLGTAQYDPEDGLWVLTPRDWFFLTDPSGPAEPKTLAAVATYPLERGGGCAPTRALNSLPSGGALAWLIEYTSLQGNVFPPRPAFFSLDDASLAHYECSASHETYMFRFEDVARFFQFHVAFGERAGDRVRSEMMATLSALLVDRCPPADTPGPVSKYGSLVPEHGAPGDVVVLTGPTGRSENWFWAPLGKIDVWWSSAPLVGPIRTGDQRLMVTIHPGTSCTFTASFEVPDVMPGDYLVTVLHYFQGGGFGFVPERAFTVLE